MSDNNRKEKKVSWKGYIITAVLVFIALLFYWTCTFKVKQHQAVIVKTMGQIDYIEYDSGLHVKNPIQSVTSIYTGNRLYDMPKSGVITSDKKSMIADDYVIWYVTDPTRYFETLGAVQARAEERIEASVYNATKKTISSMTQDDIIAARGNVLTSAITVSANSDIGQYGIEIVVAEIKALDLPDDNKQAVYDRMISERNNIAAGYTAQGNASAQKINNETDRSTSVLRAQAQANAAKIVAEGEAEYMRILSEAYNDPDKAEFYNFMIGLDALDAYVGSNKTLILDKDSEYAKLFNIQ